MTAPWKIWKTDGTGQWAEAMPLDVTDPQHAIDRARVLTQKARDHGLRERYVARPEGAPIACRCGAVPEYPLAGISVNVHLGDDTEISASSQQGCERLDIGRALGGVTVYVGSLAQAEALHRAAGEILARHRDREEQANVVQRQAGRIAELEARLGHEDAPAAEATEGGGRAGGANRPWPYDGPEGRARLTGSAPAGSPESPENGTAPAGEGGA